MKTSFNKFSLSVIFMLLWFAPAHSEELFRDDFNAYADKLTGWTQGKNVVLQKDGGINNSQCVKITYTGGITADTTLDKYIGNYNLSNIYVSFYFKTDDPSGGTKFLKLFGRKLSPEGYSNTTFALNYYSNTLSEVSYGPGEVLTNDTQATVKYIGVATDPAVSIVKSTEAFDPRDNQWHHFEAHIKYNENGQRNGIYQVWVDGRLKVHATDIKNRNDLNSMFIDTVGLAGYCHNNWTHAWNLWYDDVIISTSYVGPIKAPTSLSLTSIKTTP